MPLRIAALPQPGQTGLQVLVPRETPLHLGHLRNMVAVTEMGAIVVMLVVAMIRICPVYSILDLKTCGE